MSAPTPHRAKMHDEKSNFRPWRSPLPTVSRAISAIAASLAISLVSGCESSGSESDDWSEQPAATTATTTEKKTSSAANQAKTSPAASSTQKAAESTAGSTKAATAANSTEAATDATANTAPAAGDQVSFGALSWTYGGKPKAGGARLSGVGISELSVSSGGLSFKYVRDLSAWGLANGQAGAVACLFVQNNSGKWVGGKFDWISSSRRSRSFTNIYAGYGGWSLANVPNPCPVAFVIVSSDGTRRSNVIAGTWSR